MNDLTFARRRPWLAAVPLGLFIAIAAAWTALWFRAASAAQQEIIHWKAREAQLGRHYACDSESVGGYPFRIEVRCVGAELSSSSTDPLRIRAKDLVTIAQVYQPTLSIAEIGAPVSLEATRDGMALVAGWTLAQSSVRGLLPRPERISLAVDDLGLEVSGAPEKRTLLRAKHLELHSRLHPDSTAAHPVLELGVRLAAAEFPAAGPLALVPLDLELAAVVRGLDDLAPRPVSVVLQQLQQAGGRVEVSWFRLRRGDMVAVGAGQLGLSREGRLDGTLQVTIAGLDLRSLEGLVPRSAASLGRDGVAMSLLGLLGQPAELEGRRAVAMPLRFANGAISLGPLPLGRAAPLY
jgi:hypothetical protein